MIKEEYKKAFDSLSTRMGFEEETEKLLCAVLAERNNMKSKKLITVLVAVILAVVLTAGTVYAAVKLLTPAQVAENFDDSPLAEAFNSDDAVIINETKRAGDYNITLMGVVSGKNLSEWEDIDEEFSYISVAVERIDGREITMETGIDIRITALIEGYQPWLVNIYSLSEGARGFIEDGIYYFIYSYEALEMFADREVAFYVYSGFLGPGSDIFSYDNETGKIDYNDSYTGVRAKFELPLDSSKADPQAAREYLENFGFTLNEDGSLNLDE